MTDIDSRLSRMDRKIVESARRQLPEIAEEECPAREGDTCERTGGPCTFSACPLVENVVEGSG